MAWSEARDPGPVYAEFARILRTDAATMGNADRPRVLKCPQFAEDLPALLQHFPGARLVVTHRDAAAIVESSVSLVASQMAPQSTRRDLSAITAEWQRKLALRQQLVVVISIVVSMAADGVQLHQVNNEFAYGVQS